MTNLILGNNTFDSVPSAVSFIAGVLLGEAMIMMDAKVELSNEVVTLFVLSFDDGELILLEPDTAQQASNERGEPMQATGNQVEIEKLACYMWQVAGERKSQDDQQHGNNDLWTVFGPKYETFSDAMQVIEAVRRFGPCTVIRSGGETHGQDPKAIITSDGTINTFRDWNDDGFVDMVARELRAFKQQELDLSVVMKTSSRSQTSRRIPADEFIRKAPYGHQIEIHYNDQALCVFDALFGYQAMGGLDQLTDLQLLRYGRLCILAQTRMYHRLYAMDIDGYPTTLIEDYRAVLERDSMLVLRYGMFTVICSESTKVEGYNLIFDAPFVENFTCVCRTLEMVPEYIQKHTKEIY